MEPECGNKMILMGFDTNEKNLVNLVMSYTRVSEGKNNCVGGLNIEDNDVTTATISLCNEDIGT